MNIKLIILFIGFCTLGLRVSGQHQAVLVTGKYDDKPLIEWIQVIEQTNDIVFYFDQSVIDKIKITDFFENTSLSICLDKILSDHQLNYILFDKKVIISQEKIITELPNRYFDSPSKSEKAEPSIHDIFSAENRTFQKRDSLITIGSKANQSQKEYVRLSGHIKSATNGEDMIGAMIYIKAPKVGASSNIEGDYSINLPKGSHEMNVQSVGMQDKKINVLIYQDGILDIELDEAIVALDEVVIKGDKNANVISLQTGLDRMGIKQMKKIPSALGEVDVVRLALMLPGVQSAGEGAAGFNVRGGSTDQNLMLLNGAPLFNYAHLFGFFSLFNPDIIDKFELYKSGVPAKFGSRVSSVFEVTAKKGNKDNYSVSGGIGLVTGRLTIEGPIIKEKTSFILGLRGTYSDWLLRKIPNAAIQNSEGDFSDVYLGLDHDMNENNTLHVSGYFSNDGFRMNSDSSYQYQSLLGTAYWEHAFSDKFKGKLTGIISKYNYEISSKSNEISAFIMNYNIEERDLKLDFNYAPLPNLKLNFGSEIKEYYLDPGSYKPLGSASMVSPLILENESGRESAVYLSTIFDLSTRLSIDVGLRYSMYDYLGPKTLYQYDSSKTKSLESIQDTIIYDNSKKIKTYHGPEYRISARFILDPWSSLKLSYNRINQYVHMLSNTTSISPTDIWKLSDPNIPPQIGDQFTIGYYRNFKDDKVEFSAETYYKHIDNMLDYKNGAQLFLNEAIETDVLSGTGRAYGVELMVKKKSGKLNGWASYTYSRSLIKVDGQFPDEEVSEGEYFPSNYDKPHDFTITTNYALRHRLSFSGNLTYSTGRPITYPVAKYNFLVSDRVHYSERNQFRIPDYFRVDFSVNIEGNHKLKKLAHSSWVFSVYNVTGRKNAYSIFFVSSSGKVQGYKLSIFGQAIPTITYNFKF